jgi:hypothetical protein
MARSCPPERLAAGQGLSGSISLLTAGVAAAVAAPVYEAAGPIVLFGGAAAGMALLVVAARAVDTRGGARAVPGRISQVGELPAERPGEPVVGTGPAA